MQSRLVLFCCLFSIINGENVLVIYPFTAGSHNILLDILSKSLIERNHTVTTIRFGDVTSPRTTENFLHPQKHTNLVPFIDNSDYSLSHVTYGPNGTFDIPSELLWTSGNDFFRMLKMAYNAPKVFNAVCDIFLANSSYIRSHIESDRFDVVVIDVFLNECGLALANSVVKAPVVGLWAFPCTGGEMIFTQCDSHLLPQWLTGLTEQMNFFQRFYNFIQRILQKSFMYYHSTLMDYFISKHFDDAVSSIDILNSMNKFIVNGDGIVDYARKMPPDFLNAAGMQIKKKLDKLPTFLSEWLDSAEEEGVILFSLGVTFQARFVPEERLETFLDALSSFSQRVLFKFDSPEKISHLLPSNVLCMKHVPQQEVLAHPNTVLFFTHFGLKSVVEAIYFGVPMVGTPIFLDQSNMAALVEYRGIGLSVDKWAGKQEIREAVERVLNDGEIKRKVKKMSSLMKDSWRLHPLDRAVHLVEEASKNQLGNVRNSNQNDNLLIDVFLGVSVMGAVFCAAEFTFNRVLKFFSRSRKKE